MTLPNIDRIKLEQLGRHLALLFVLCAWLIPASAQDSSCSYTVSGKILDVDDKTPIPYVSVKVHGTEKYTETNENGEFEIGNLCKENNTLIISCIGYCDTSCVNHNLHEDAPNIYLIHKVSELGPVTIQVEKNQETGTKSLSQITLKKELLRSNPTQTLAALLANQQGVSLTSKGANVQLPVIHGLYGNRILVLNNGLKHGFQNWGSDHAPEIDISTAHKLTLIKGASGVRYGPEALGGAISIENAPLYLNEPLNVNVGTGYQTNGRGYFTNAEIYQGLKKWSYHLGANFTQIGDRHTPDYMLTNSGKIEKSMNAGLRYVNKRFEAKAYYSYMDQNLAILRASIGHSGDAFVNALNAEEPLFNRPFSYDINQPNQFVKHHLAKAEMSWAYSEEGKLTLRYGRQLNKREEYDVRRNAEIPIIDLDLTTNDYQLEWKHPDWRFLDGLIGFQVFTQLNDNNPGTQTTPFIPNYKSTQYSGFIVENIKRNRNTFELGIRGDFVQNYVAGRETNQEVFFDDFNFTNVTSSVGYVRDFSDNTSFRANIGTAWRTPNMAELYSFGQSGFKTIYGLLRHYFTEDGEPRTNRVLKLFESGVQPEKGYKFITEFKTIQKNSTHTITAYTHYIENFIFQRPLGVFGTIRGPNPAFIYDQADAFFAGADYNWKMAWSDRLTGTLGASYLWSRNIEDDEPLINQPPITVNYQLTYELDQLWKLESSKFTIKPSYTFQQFDAPRTVSPESLIDGSEIITSSSEIFDFTDAPEAYFLLDMSWSFKWKNISASIAVNNIFNVRYRDYLNDMRYFADEPGRNFLFTVNYSFRAKSK